MGGERFSWRRAASGGLATPPLVVAHRGASAAAPENTLPAFALAVAMGAAAVELDVRLSADGVLVVCHDADFARTTDADEPVYVHEHPLAVLHRYDAGYRFSPDGGRTFPFRGRGVRIATLDDVVDALPPTVGLNIEIKEIPGDPGFDPARLPVTTALVAYLAGEPCVPDRVIVSSFNHHAIERVRLAGLGIGTGYLVPPGVPLLRALDGAVVAGHHALHPAAETLVGGAGSLIARAHAAGLSVNVWTVDDPARARELAHLGVDGIITNRPNVLAHGLATSET